MKPWAPCELGSSRLSLSLGIQEVGSAAGSPLARALFRLLFRRVNGAEEAAVEKELLNEGIAE